MKHHVIYVPGLGDQRPHGQSLFLNLWRLFGLTPHYHPVGWTVDEPFQVKLERLLKHIDSLKSADNKVSLVGVSAGASTALTAYSLRTRAIAGVVCISGKIQNPQTINPRYFAENPAFEESVKGLQAALAKLGPGDIKRIMSIHPVKDQTVPPADTIIPGALEKQVPAFGHIQSIFYCLAFKGLAIASFLRKQ